MLVATWHLEARPPQLLPQTLFYKAQFDETELTIVQFNKPAILPTKTNLAPHKYCDQIDHRTAQLCRLRNRNLRPSVARQQYFILLLHRGSLILTPFLYSPISLPLRKNLAACRGTYPAWGVFVPRSPGKVMSDVVMRVPVALSDVGPVRRVAINVLLALLSWFQSPCG